MKKRGVSLLSVIFIIIAIVVIVIIGVSVAKGGKIEKNTKKKNSKEKFSMQMLEENGFGEDVTLEDLKNRFNDIKLTSSYVKTSTGVNVDEYTSNDVKLLLANNKLSEASIKKEDFQFNGVKVSKGIDDVLKAFYQESDGKDITDENNNIIGKYIYGTYNLANLQEQKIYGTIEYAFIGNENTKSQEYDYVIKYICMEPPYKKIYASDKDKVATLEFGMKDDKVKSINIKIINE